MNMDRNVTLLNLIAGAAASDGGQFALPMGPSADVRASPAATWVEAG